MTGSTTQNDLLIEIGTEELPPKSLQHLLNAFMDGMDKALNDKGIQFDRIQGYVTPRRLSMIISALDGKEQPRTITKKGPAKTASFDKDGNPTKALLGFLSSVSNKSTPAKIEDLTLEETEKGAWYVYREEEKGKSIEDFLPPILEEVLGALPLPKRMRWGNGDYVFVRPVHWVVLLYGNKVIDALIFGIRSNHFTHGHRFHHPEKIKIGTPKEYESQLFSIGKVSANFQKRKETIEKAMQKEAEKHRAVITEDKDLLDEVTGLVEWPVILLGSFDKSFLDIPKEALISSMKRHQKCFPLEDGDPKYGDPKHASPTYGDSKFDERSRPLLPKFIIVSNIESKDPNAVIRGNESVMNARLKDAVFLYQVDRQSPLESRLEKLKGVVFQQGLGSLYDKSKRIEKLASNIAQKLNANVKAVARAGFLCKADLLTHMVEEFPELQGVMGRYYAINDGEDKSVAEIIEEHYYPRFADDDVPFTLEGGAVALADRIDSLVGIFSLGKRPTGDKDPYGLRRQALACLRIMIENQMPLDLQDLFVAAKTQYDILLEDTALIKPLLDFCFERLRAWYHEQEVPARVFDAVLAKWPTKPTDFDFRIKAVTDFLQLPEAESLIAANKRVKNILTKSDSSDVFNPEDIKPEDIKFDLALMQEPKEKSLAEALLRTKEKIDPQLRELGFGSHYTNILKECAKLKAPIDEFFDHVMVMVDDEKIRNNRLKMLNCLRALFTEIADISIL